ncbi:hypothetical protein PV325_005479, partial [Microctonus aethiopoides]
TMITLVLGGRDDPHHNITRDVTALNSSFSHHYQLTKWRVSRPKLVTTRSNYYIINVIKNNIINSQDLFYYLSTLKMRAFGVGVLQVQ